jgi:phosphate transport system permease protein
MRRLKDLFARRVMLIWTASPGIILLLITVGLVGRSKAILALKPIGSLLLGTSWHPLRGQFGFWPFISGTLWVTLVAMVLAVPISLLTAVYLSEYAPRPVRRIAAPVIDLLAGIPSVVYGVWGVLMIVPFVNKVLAPAFGAYSSGYSVAAAGIVLAVMVFPTIIHVSLEVFASVPRDLREASLSLGATSWETVKHVVLRKGLPGIVAAVVLGVSRAFGETMAVLMVAGNVARSPHSVFDPGYTLPALLANNYGEMMSIPLYDSALMLAAFVLFAVVLVFNIAARVFLVRVERSVE